MGRLEELNRINEVPVLSIFGPEFREFGRIVPGIAAAGLFRYMETETPVPEEGNIYVPSDPELERLPGIAEIRGTVFGGMDIQAGYCNGRNTTYNGCEYHKSPEVNAAVSDFMLVLGRCSDISDELSYSVDLAKVFYVPRGTVIELFGTTLHLSPVRTCPEGFRCVVILPRGTNTPLSEEERAAARSAVIRGDKEARLLLQKHKWVIAHPEREPLIRQGAYPGVTGPNRELRS